MIEVYENERFDLVFKKAEEEYGLKPYDMLNQPALLLTNELIEEGKNDYKEAGRIFKKGKNWILFLLR